jgi:hypothetical protein
MQGRSLRAGFLFNPSRLAGVGGIKAISKGGYFRQGPVANCGIPLYAAMSDLSCIVPNAQVLLADVLPSTSC